MAMDTSQSESDLESDLESIDSDKELQVAFQKGLLKPGLNVVTEEKTPTINDVAGLKQALSDLKSNLPWIERMDMTSNPIPPPKPVAEQLGEDPDDLSADAVHDDFKREMKFYRQAQGALLDGLPMLKMLGIPTRRPDDYLAEMAKSDHHMKKVREKLLSKQLSMERSEKAKKLRDLRKYGKKVQQEVLQKRQKEKKDMMDNIKKHRKGQQAKLDFLEDGMAEMRQQQTGSKGRKQEKHNPKENKKRQLKNKKFGFGGQKKRSKYNTAQSAAEESGFSIKKNSQRAKGPAKQGNKNRPSKRRRQTQKNTGRRKK